MRDNMRAYFLFPGLSESSVKCVSEYVPGMSEKEFFSSYSSHNKTHSFTFIDLGSEIPNVYFCDKINSNGSVNVRGRLRSSIPGILYPRGKNTGWKHQKMSNKEGSSYSGDVLNSSQESDREIEQADSGTYNGNGAGKREFIWESEEKVEEQVEEQDPQSEEEFENRGY